MPSRFNFRFSVLSLLLIVTLAAVTTSHVLLSRRNAALAARIREQQKTIRAQNDKLGQLTVDDPEQVHILDTSAREMPGRLPETFEWEMYAPPKTRWRVFWATKKIPASGISMERLGGDLLQSPIDRTRFDVSIRRPVANGLNSRLDLRFESQVWKVELDPVEATWLDENTAISWEGAGGTHYWDHATQSFKSDQPVVLLRVRRQSFVGAIGGVEDNPNPCEGLMIWLEPAKN